jgi:hypothetical protein
MTPIFVIVEDAQFSVASAPPDVFRTHVDLRVHLSIEVDTYCPPLFSRDLLVIRNGH